MASNSQNQKGFTLLEIMTVMAILGIILAIAAPQFHSYKIKAYNSAACSDIKSASLIYFVYQSENDRFPDSFDITSGSIRLTDGGKQTGLKINTSLDVALGGITATDKQSFTMGSKHKNGDIAYQVDSESFPVPRRITSVIGRPLLKSEFVMQ